MAVASKVRLAVVREGVRISVHQGGGGALGRSASRILTPGEAERLVKQLSGILNSIYVERWFKR